MLPDHLSSGLAVVFCGTAAGRRSAEMGHYYAGPGNRFWPTLFEIGLTPRLISPKNDLEVLNHGIGLTDLAKGVAGVDRDIPVSAYAPERLYGLVHTWKPKRLAFTSISAAKFGLGIKGRVVPGVQRFPALPDTEIWALPSPSGLARGHWSIGPWMQLAASIRPLRYAPADTAKPSCSGVRRG